MSASYDKNNVCVVVLGDIGRSPRMQYHVQSLVKDNYNVDLIGYLETQPLEEISSNSRIKIHPMKTFPEYNLPNTLKYIFKTLWQTLGLLIALFSIRRANFLLCQNPPGIPTLFVCYIYSVIMRSKFIIDWHNYTYTILSINSSPNSLIVRIAKWTESYFGRKSYRNLCVTRAMQEDLLMHWNIEATVLYDRPPSIFQSVNLQIKHKLFMKLASQYSEFANANAEFGGEVLEANVFTKKLQTGAIEYLNNCPGLLVSSTSWTPDEDFSILLDALETYEIQANSSTHYPKLICVITGKGPQKAYYKELLSKKNWNNVTVITPWLENEEYPLLLASSNLGVCLHWSSSGLDLPMKVVDMFGCGLPVCAVNFKCLSELVQHEKNGFIFENSKELAFQIQEWFYDYPDNIALINLKENFSKNLSKFQSLRWDENWRLNALPLFK